METMTDGDLIGRAEALGVTATYLNWRKERVQVPEETLRAIVAALTGRARLAGGRADAVSLPGPAPAARPDDPAGPSMPQERCWGFTVQLYSVRSRRSWGYGDLHDLADLARWSAGQHGADFVLINPLHAAEPDPPLSNSPYLPMTRRYASPLYLRIEDIPEYQQLNPAQRQYVDDLAVPLQALSSMPDLIDRDRVWAAKRAALEVIYQVPRRAERESAYRAYAAGQGAELADWANWCALAEEHGPDWREWPPGLGGPASAALATGSAQLAGRAGFHAWLQWLLDEQLSWAQRAALGAGMRIGVIGDLAVGVHPGGSDSWAHQDVLVRGFSVGAPPDEFNQRGQDWAQPPWHPQGLAATGAAPLADLFGAAFAHAGGLRVDHVMGLTRLWWVPEGSTPDRGAYVSYDHRLTVGALTAAARRAGGLAIGEDLGTVEPWITEFLASQQVLGTEMAWFATEPGGSPLPPRRWRRGCMATVGTHDMPPVAGFVTGDHVSVRAQLGLLPDPEAERKAAELKVTAWHDALVGQGLLAPGPPASPPEFTVAMYGYLARTPALLTGVSLADAVGERRTQNIPGTTDEYPNWRVPLCDGEGKAVLIEDLPDLGLVRQVANAAAPGPGPGAPAR
jgi:4-alpha-glucanotransferase